MKILPNRRRTMPADGITHLVRVDQDALSSTDASVDDSAQDVASLSPGHPAERAVRPVATLHPMPAMPSQSNGRAAHFADPADVEWMVEEGALTPFRVFRAFDYSVSLLFHARELKYYVALYQDGTPWRALKASDLDAAQGIFHQFEMQAIRLADGQTRRVQLEAQNDQLTKMIAQSEAQAEQLRKALQRSATQEQTVTSRQHQVRREVALLEAQRVAAQAQLNKVHRQIHQLDLAAHDGVPHMTNR
ncbi:DUF2968 domain-containing protein [Paraburkholderia rhizosphaerae]|uniref:DUF2968 family protein n=1 Tax=Paraburkholderia rhizosphaerae TaxID=480658 RepID=A0A4R8M2Q8_9BURK|nr:DUF2968 domain-containing protein [Paraburkholderia rhizosphaerae]TDY53993.1 Protein of unknown function (DUF2968) [Paraburkholderia rhizosphaerae]